MVNTGARQVGYAMAAVTPDLDVPWHRVINSKGELSPRKNGKIDRRQRELLLAEGVLFDKLGRVDFERFGWIEAELPYFEGGIEE
jgi:methylated-DNA-protein-cysteine methyltransferase-like protein